MDVYVDSGIDLKKAWRCCISNDTESMYSARDIGTGS